MLQHCAGNIKGDLQQKHQISFNYLFQFCLFTQINLSSVLSCGRVEELLMARKKSLTQHFVLFSLKDYSIAWGSVLMRHVTVKGIMQHLLYLQVLRVKNYFSWLLPIRYNSRRDSCISYAKTTYLGYKLKTHFALVVYFMFLFILADFFLALKIRHHLMIFFPSHEHKS